MKDIKTKFRPILFSTPMVQALLERRKTMTRRTKGLEKINKNPDEWEFWRFFDGYAKFVQKYNCIKEEFIKCPYQVGDVFWVRENFYTASNWDQWKPSMLKSVNVEVFYSADIPNYDIARPLSRGKIRPCIFLPFEYSRIFLKIKSIRVERLQAISTEDARSEGIKSDAVSEAKFINYVTGVATYSEKTSFYSLWESINGKESVENNPFVFVYEFEQIEKPLEFN